MSAVAASATGVAGRGVPWHSLRVIGALSASRFRVSQDNQWNEGTAVTTSQGCVCVDRGFESSACFQ